MNIIDAFLRIATLFGGAIFLYILLSSLLPIPSWKEVLEELLGK